MDVMKSSIQSDVKVNTTTFVNAPEEKQASQAVKKVEQMQEGRKIDEKEMPELVDKMNTLLNPALTSLRFKIHSETNKYYVELVDIVKDEVIREIPSKKMLDIYAAMDEFIGLLFDKKA